MLSQLSCGNKEVILVCTMSGFTRPRRWTSVALYVISGLSGNICVYLTWNFLKYVYESVSNVSHLPANNRPDSKNELRNI